MLMLILVVYLSLIHLIDKKNDKLSLEIEEEEEAMKESSDSAISQSLKKRRLNYLKKVEENEKVKNGIEKFNEGVKDLTTNTQIIEKVEDELVKNLEYTHLIKYPISDIDDKQENILLKNTEGNKVLKDFWNKRSVDVNHFIHLNQDGERNVHIIFYLRM